MAVNLFAPGGGPFVGPLLVGVSKAGLTAAAGAAKFPATQTLAGWPADPLAFSLMPARTQARAQQRRRTRAGACLQPASLLGRRAGAQLPGERGRLSTAARAWQAPRSIA